MSEAEKTPRFWPASLACEGLVHYSREALEHNTEKDYLLPVFSANRLFTILPIYNCSNLDTKYAFNSNNTVLL